MAMFSEKGAASSAETNLSIIGTGMRVVGDISSEGVVKVEGVVQGTIQAARQVLVAKGGLVEGDIVTREAILGGEVRGAVQASERIEIQGTCVVHGDLTARRLLVQEGGEVNGVVRMAAPEGVAEAIRGEGGTARAAV